METACTKGVGLLWQYSLELYDRLSVRLQLKVRMPKAEVVVETLLYGCVT